MIDIVAATGDAGDIHCWSGTPYYFTASARDAGWPVQPGRLNMKALARSRMAWNALRLLRGLKPGGFQYEAAFLARAEEQLLTAHGPGRLLTFNQHFPRSLPLAQKGYPVVRYLDATLASFCREAEWARHLPDDVRRRALDLEWENFVHSERVVTMARWAAEDIKALSVDPAKVHTILPGANLVLPKNHQFLVRRGNPGGERPLVLGFLGKDWRRKGLRFLLHVRSLLAAMGLSVVVRCAGNCPRELRGTPGLEYVGFIDKAREPGRFLRFLEGCDLGCLFSDHEPLGISTLEFLRAGVPVAGFALEGMADTLPPDAGFRFKPDADAALVAERLRDAFAEESEVENRNAAARRWSSLVTWERCVAEWSELLTTGTLLRPVQLWRGLPSSPTEGEIRCP